MILAIASGKGGTGKTSLACAIAKALSPDIGLADCDAEEPDCSLFLNPEIESEKNFSVPFPVVDESLCDGCGHCQQVCLYNAIKIFKGKPVIFPNLCHSCGGCFLACPKKAIKETSRPIGKIRTGNFGKAFYIDGIMNIGEASPVSLIKAIKKIVPSGKDIIIDCPPGTSCPVVAAISGADFCILVSEPTPFGLSDLNLALETVDNLKIPRSLVINRSDIGNEEMEKWCQEKKLDILLKIPFDRKIAEDYSKGKTMIESKPEYADILRKVFLKIKSRIDK
jgi:MinD superfamily P-loop ATPase